MFTLLQSPTIVSTPFHSSVSFDGSPTAAGRFCAAKALAALNPAGAHAVGRHADGSPIWPAGVVGSITHTHGYAAAAVAYDTQRLGLGIDSENVNNSAAMEVAGRIVYGKNEEAVLKMTCLSIPNGRLLLFCAKESIYKCFYPLVHRAFDYAAVEIIAIDTDSGRFQFQLLEMLHPNFPKFFRGTGRFTIRHGCMHAGVELRKDYGFEG